jgi:antitoxin component of RelBE/YafQ-DinJ toxin-antitoxin module
MQITVDIPDEAAAQAQARGLTPETYVRKLVEDAVRTGPLPLPPAKPSMTTEEFLRVFSSNSEKMPALPDEAFTRESFYQDHD